jgi:hypothetical protein
MEQPGQSVDAGLWTARLPPGWVVEDDEEEESLLVYHPDGPGTLQVTCSEMEDGLVDEEDLRYFAAELLDEGLEPARVNLGHLQGLKFEYEDDAEDEHVIEWYLAGDDLFFFVTYSCPLEARGREDHPVAEFLHSIELAA